MGTSSGLPRINFGARPSIEIAEGSGALARVKRAAIDYAGQAIGAGRRYLSNTFFGRILVRSQTRDPIDLHHELRGIIRHYKGEEREDRQIARLVREGADLFRGGMLLREVGHYLIEERAQRVYEIIIDNMPDINAESDAGYNIINALCDSHYPEEKSKILERALNRGAIIKSSRASHPLHDLAESAKDLDSIKLIAERCGEYDFLDGEGSTPLGRAMAGDTFIRDFTNDRRAIVEYFLARGADMQKTMPYLGKRMEDIIHKNWGEMLELAIANGFDPCAAPRNLMLKAVRCGSWQIARRLSGIFAERDFLALEDIDQVAETMEGTALLATYREADQVRHREGRYFGMLGAGIDGFHRDIVTPHANLVAALNRAGIDVPELVFKPTREEPKAHRVKALFHEYRYYDFLRIIAKADKIASELDPGHRHHSPSDIFINLFKNLKKKNWTELIDQLDAMNCSAVEMRDSVRRVVDILVLPQVLFAMDEKRRMALNREQLDKIRSACTATVARELFKDRDIRQVFRLCERFEQESGRITAKIREMPISGRWHKAFTDYRFTEGGLNGYTVEYLDTGEKLVQEGKSMHNCIANYTEDCKEGREHVAAIRDPEGRTISNFRFRMATDPYPERDCISYPGGVLVIEEHRGDRNSNPPELANAAFAEFKKLVSEGSIKIQGAPLGTVRTAEGEGYPAYEAIGFKILNQANIDEAFGALLKSREEAPDRFNEIVEEAIRDQDKIPKLRAASRYMNEELNGFLDFCEALEDAGFSRSRRASVDLKTHTLRARAILDKLSGKGSIDEFQTLSLELKELERKLREEIDHNLSLRYRQEPGILTRLRRFKEQEFIRRNFEILSSDPRLAFLNRERKGFKLIPEGFKIKVRSKSAAL